MTDDLPRSLCEYEENVQRSMAERERYPILFEGARGGVEPERPE
jgi:hypothetical protein